MEVSQKYKLPVVLFTLGFSLITLANQPATTYGTSYIDAVTPTFFDGKFQRMPAIQPWKPGDPIKEIPKRRKLPRVTLPVESKIPFTDPLLAIQNSALNTTTNRAFSNTILNYPGQGFSGVNPPDTNGDVGINYYIQMINGAAGSRVIIYNKFDGSIALTPFTLSGMGSGNCASGSGDPIVLFDSLARRWLLSEFSDTANRLCVYISTTQDPLGSYYAYEFTTPNFPDYPKYSVWTNGYFVTSNESSDSPIYALDKNKMLTGSPASLQRFSVPLLGGFGFDALTPADVDGTRPPPANAPAYFARHRDDEAHNAGSSNTSKDFLEIWTVNADFSNPANSSLTGPLTIDVAEFDSSLCGYFSFSCFPQPGTGITLDPLREIIMWRLQYRNQGSYESLLGNFVTDVNGNDRGGIRWFELRKTTSGWALHQEGTFSPDSVNRWMGSIAMDKNGNIALGYNATNNTNVFPEIRYTGRLSTDPLGTLPLTETVIIAGTSANSSNRYGDYSSMSIDPVNGCTFWFTGEHNQAANWSTQISSFKFNSCTNYVPAGNDCSYYSYRASNGITVTICL